MEKGNHTAVDVARWFIKRNNEYSEAYGGEGGLSQLKLQKLLYYAQGMYMIMSLPQRQLFDDDIVAWEHGPVVPTVYYRYEQYGRNIPYNKTSKSMQPEEEYTEEDIRILNQVFEQFAQYSGWKLKNMSQNEQPWKCTEKNQVIPASVIFKYFNETYMPKQPNVAMSWAYYDKV